MSAVPKNIIPEKTPEIYKKAGLAKSALAGGSDPGKYNSLTGEEKVILEQVAELIRTALIESEMTQKELAKKLGFHPRHLSAMMHGQRNINLRLLAKIGEVTGYRFNIVASKFDS